MTEIALTLSIFAALVTAAFGARRASARMKAHHVSKETNAVVRLVAGLFVVMTSLVFGLLINSSRTGFEALGSQVQSYAAHLILLDRTLAARGSDTDKARQLLADYVQAAIDDPARVQQDEALRSYRAEDRLAAVYQAFSAIPPSDDRGRSLLDDASRQYRQIIEQRWTIIEAGQGRLPFQMTLMLAGWLVLIFASFGYRAPCNAVIDLTFVSAAGLIAGSLYLVLDMNVPFSGPMQISDLPLRQALAELRRTLP
ncbi:bestrophin-like domain [Paracoccus benzoatiresistens]|uniref:DUF4239 domain-containing protein n=1 Tax=Paracoccus benzoatiresistens TaxID=2997341 RepID=A0ABT4J220_9RHOB|nr:DUF4239 domain-containing protein [Paracoccus sp. EF6]MCZ0960954.1 DUF4239 domain-containing protein [Paracoccus sp. EF6]